MKKLLVSILSASLLVLSVVLPSSEAAIDFAKLTTSLTSRINAFFPITEVYVVSVQNNQIFIENGDDKKLRKGMELQLFREGKEFTHPITGVSLGKFEESLGTIRITDVKETYAICETISLKKESTAKRGDKARITSSPIKLAVIMEENSSSANFDINTFINNFIYKLEENGKYEVVSQSEILLARNKLAIQREDLLNTPDYFKKLGRELGVMVFIVNSSTQFSGSRIMTSRIVSATSGRQIDKAAIDIPLLSPSPPATVSTQKSPGFSPSPESGLIQKKKPIHKKKDQEFISKIDTSYLGVGKGVRQSQELDYEIFSFTTGDFDGDGQKEIGIIDGKRLRIYKFDSTKLSLVWSEPEQSSGCMTVDAIDLNHNGKEELFITKISYSRLQSYVIEFQDGNYKRVASKLPFFFRTIKFKSKTKQLFVQRIGVATPFSGSVHTCIYENGQYMQGKSLDLPKGVFIFGFANADIDQDGERDFIYVDDHDRLRIFSKDGELKWKSNSRYGGYGLTFAHTSKRVFSSRSPIKKRKPDRIKVKGRIFVMDLDRDGINEIILGQNFSSLGSFFPNSPSFSKSRIIDLEWDGISFSENWETRHIEAYLADFDIEDIYGDGRDNLLIGLVLNRGITNIFKKTKSVILFYQL